MCVCVFRSAGIVDCSCCMSSRGTPVDQLPHIETQLTQAHLVTHRYSELYPDQLDATYEKKIELAHIMERDRRPKIDFTCIHFLVSRFTLCSARKRIKVVGIGRGQ